MADKDAQTELKKRARRRLVGAVALAVAAAVVLPMVMDHEPRPNTQDIQIRIPSPDSGGFEARVPPGKPAGSAPGEVRPAPSEPVPPVAAARPQAPAATEPAKPEPKPPEPEKPVAGPASSPPPTVETKSPPAAALAAEEAARARAILNDRGQFIVQLGVFADPANVTKVRARVKAEGYNSFIEKLDGGDRGKTRVRAGPFTSREEAERAREKLKRAGLPGIVAPKT